MVTLGRPAAATAQGHVALYSRDARWRKSAAASLATAGHSYLEAREPLALREILERQRFDVFAVKVRDDQDAQALAAALDGARLPQHGIFAGSTSCLRLVQRLQQGSFRYIPGPVAADELTRLIGASISAGTCEESAIEHGDGSTAAHIEEIDIEEAIEEAASVVYRAAKRRSQHFRTLVEGGATAVLADPRKLRRTLVALLDLLVAIAPRGAIVAVEARANQDGWLIQLSTSVRRGSTAAHLAEVLHEETTTVASASRDISEQGGLLWVEVSSPSNVSICVTLPIPNGTAERRFS